MLLPLTVGICVAAVINFSALLNIIVVVGQKTRPGASK